MEGTDVQWLDPGSTLPQAAAAELEWAWEALRKCTRCRAMVVFYKCVARGAPRPMLPQASCAHALGIHGQAVEGSRHTCTPARTRRGRHLFHAGSVRPGIKLGAAQTGETCSTCMRTGQGNYLANLTLYPGAPLGPKACCTCHAVPRVTRGGAANGSACPTERRARARVHTGRAEFMSFLPEGTQGVVVQPIGSAGVLLAATDTVRGFGRMDQVRTRCCRARACLRMSHVHGVGARRILVALAQHSSALASSG